MILVFDIIIRRWHHNATLVLSTCGMDRKCVYLCQPLCALIWHFDLSLTELHGRYFTCCWTMMMAGRFIFDNFTACSLVTPERTAGITHSFTHSLLWCLHLQCSMHCDIMKYEHISWLYLLSIIRNNGDDGSMTTIIGQLMKRFQIHTGQTGGITLVLIYVWVLN